MSKVEINEVKFEEMVKKGKSKSSIMREMYDNGYDVSSISKLSKSHYSFVYGVISRYCESKGEEIKSNKKESKSDIIRSKYDEGMTIGEISKSLNSNYSFVFSVCKKHRESK